MAEHIKVGDLVMMAYPTRCCGSYDGYGNHWVVERLVDDGTEHCETCGAWTDGPAADCPSTGQGALSYRLKVIKPDELPPINENFKCVIGVMT